MYSFIAMLDIIGVNPFVFVPEDILAAIFKKAAKHKGPIPVHGTLNGKPYKQTLVKYSGYWRLYINTTMLKNYPKHIGESITITIDHDDSNRAIEPPESFLTALMEHQEARSIFNSLPASRKNEIVRYLAHLKTEEALEKNITRAIHFLLGNQRFIGRDKP